MVRGQQAKPQLLGALNIYNKMWEGSFTRNEVTWDASSPVLGTPLFVFPAQDSAEHGYPPPGIVIKKKKSVLVVSECLFSSNSNRSRWCGVWGQRNACNWRNWSSCWALSSARNWCLAAMILMKEKGVHIEATCERLRRDLISTTISLNLCKCTLCTHITPLALFICTWACLLPLLLFVLLHLIINELASHFCNQRLLLRPFVKWYTREYTVSTSRWKQCFKNKL